MQSFRRKAASLDELRQQVLLAYGPEARIVDATRVTRKGLGRLFAHEEIEATVVVPDGAGPAGGVAPERVDRAGIAALLADADEADGSDDDGREDAPGPRPSTGSRSFAALLAEVERSLGAPGDGGAAGTPGDGGAAGAPESRFPRRADTDAARGDDATRTAAPPALGPAIRLAPVPPLIARAAAPGDLVLVVGLGDDAVTAARGLAGSVAGAPLRLHGDAPDAEAPIADRRAALAARMRAVEREEAVVLALAVGFDHPFEWLAELRPDEVWAAVDVSRRLDDAAAWVGRLQAVLPVAAIAAVGSSRTRHPLDLSPLGPRIGWYDDEAAARRA